MFSLVIHARIPAFHSPHEPLNAKKNIVFTCILIKIDYLNQSNSDQEFFLGCWRFLSIDELFKTVNFSHVSFYGAMNSMGFLFFRKKEKRLCWCKWIYKIKQNTVIANTLKINWHLQQSDLHFPGPSYML